MSPRKTLAASLGLSVLCSGLAFAQTCGSGMGATGTTGGNGAGLSTDTASGTSSASTGGAGASVSTTGKSSAMAPTAGGAGSGPADGSDTAGGSGAGAAGGAGGTSGGSNATP